MSEIHIFVCVCAGMDVSDDCVTSVTGLLRCTPVKLFISYLCIYILYTFERMNILFLNIFVIFIMLYIIKSLFG